MTIAYELNKNIKFIKILNKNAGFLYDFLKAIPCLKF